MKLTVIILAKNSEVLIADCIESVKFADEIIVIDGNSIDRTVEIAERMGARIIKSDEKSFAKRRNIGLSNAKGEWVFYIDTDERVSKKLATFIQAAIAQNAGGIVAYTVSRQNFYLGNHAWPKIEKLERLFKKENLKRWYGDLHESPQIEGSLGQLDGLLLHYTHRDLSSMLEKTILWSDTEAQLRLDAHHPKMTLWRFPRVIITAFWNSYVTQKGWKAGTMGLIESIYQAFSMFVTYAKLWELQQKDN